MHAANGMGEYASDGGYREDVRVADLRRYEKARSTTPWARFFHFVQALDQKSLEPLRKARGAAIDEHDCADD